MIFRLEPLTSFQYSVWITGHCDSMTFSPSAALKNRVGLLAAFPSVIIT